MSVFAQKGVFDRGKKIGNLFIISLKKKRK